MSAADHGQKIERMLDEVQAVAGPVAWPRVEALVTALVDLYGTGLERLLDHARAAAADRAELDRAIGRDEIVSSLLVLHGCHPVALEERISRALGRVRTEVPEAAPLAFVGLEGGVVMLRVADEAEKERAPSLQVVARAIEHEAPEVEGVRIEGLAAAPPKGDLVPAERLLRGGRV